MKKVSRWIAAALAAGMIAALFAGCGEGRKPGGPKGDTVTLNVWIQSVNQPDYFYGWFKDAFEAENPGIELKITPQSQGTLGASLVTSLKSADGPDITATWGGTILPGLVDSDVVAELDDVITPEREKDMVQMALLNKENGKHYGAPIFGFASPVVFYNKTQFAKLGVAEPKTYQELVAVSKKIRSAAYQPVVSGYTYHIPQAIHARTMSEADLRAIIEPDTSYNPFLTESYRQGWEWIAQMIKDGVFADNISGYSTTTAESAFINQNALMYSTTSLDLLAVSQQASFEIGCFVFPDAPDQYVGSGVTPAGKSVGKISGVYTDVMVIRKQTKHMVACKKFLEFLYSDEAQAQMFNFFMFPVRKNISYDRVDDDVKAIFNSAFKPLYDDVSAHDMTLFYMVYSKKAPALDNTLEKAFGKIAAGGDVGSAVAEVAKQWKS